MKKILFFLALLSSTVVTAEPRQATLDVETPLEVISGVGLLMTPGKVIQKDGVEISRIEKNLVRATFSFDSNEVTPDTLASVMLFTSEGDAAVGTLRRLSSTPDAATVPACPPDKAVAATSTSQVGLLQSLVSVRSARRDNAQARVHEMMKDDFVATLRKLEKGFGLVYAKELSPDLPPLELIDRLSRIANAVKNYRTTKPKTTP